MSARRRRWRLAPLLVALLTAGAAGRAQAAAPPPLTGAQQAALDAFDRVLGRFARLVAQDNDAGHQISTRGQLDDLQKRREALRAAFDNSKCEDLKAEAILDLQREAAWLRPGAAGATSPARK